MNSKQSQKIREDGSIRWSGSNEDATMIFRSTALAMASRQGAA